MYNNNTMETNNKILTDDEMINYYMHKIDISETKYDKNMNKIFYKKSKKYKIDNHDASFTFITVGATPKIREKVDKNTYCFPCFLVKWPKIFDVNDE
jgi:hypothetical protein